MKRTAQGAYVKYRYAGTDLKIKKSEHKKYLDAGYTDFQILMELYKAKQELQTSKKNLF